MVICMGENSGNIGKQLENYVTKFFARFKWRFIANNREIECTKRATHNKKSHGLDVIFDFYNPYQSVKQTIVVECKSRKNQSITLIDMQKWVDELISTIECMQSSRQLEDLNITDGKIDSGMLVVFSNDGYAKEKIDKLLGQINVRVKRNPISIYVADNNYLKRWKGLLIFSELKNNFNFIYPSIDKSSRSLLENPTLDILYSTYIFAEYIDDKDGCPKKTAALISFDDVTIASFRYMWSMFKNYQLESYDQYSFVFYGKTAAEINYIESEFARSLTFANNNEMVNFNKKVKFDFIEDHNLIVR